MALNEVSTEDGLHATAGLHHRCRANSLRGNSNDSSSSYAPVEAVSRALLLLRCLNEMQHGTIAELHRRTGVPKPTIVRALETFISEGYVARDNLSGGYRITSQVLALSSGFSGTALIIEAARVHAIKLTERIKWPVSIGTVVDGCVVVNFTTTSISPLAYPFPILHKPMSVMHTAMGRCHLSFCSDSEREALVARYQTVDPTANFKAARMRRTILDVRRKGYALQDPFVEERMFVEAKRFQFAAVPIRDDGVCVAHLGVGFYKRAVRPDDIGRLIVAPMHEAAAGIESKIALLKRGHKAAG